MGKPSEHRGDQRIHQGEFGVPYSDDAVRKLPGKQGIIFIRPIKVPANPSSVEEQLGFVKKLQ